MGKITIATACMHVVYDKKKNMEKYMQLIDEAATHQARLIVFPEMSLQGYLENLSVYKESTVSYQHREAEVVPDGEATQQLMQKAKEKHMYIIFGMTEKDPEYPDQIYNTAVLVGPEGYIGKYRKVHLPMDEAHLFCPGNEINVFQTELGKIGMLICYDKDYPETARILAVKGAQILAMPTAWSLSPDSEDTETNYSVYVYDLLDRTRAMENQVFFVSSNQIGTTGDIHYFGRSRIVSPMGKPVAEQLNTEGLAFYTTDIEEEIIKVRTTGLFGLNLMKDRRPGMYGAIAQEGE